MRSIGAERSSLVHPFVAPAPAANTPLEYKRIVHRSIATCTAMKRLSALLLLAALLALASNPARAQAPRRPNIVFILADDLGYTDVGCFGSKYYETPNIDRLATQGMKFTSGYTCGSNCQPTRAALMSGQYGARTGVYTVGGINRFDWQSRPL